MMVVSSTGTYVVPFDQCIWKCECRDGGGGTIIAIHNNKEIEMLVNSNFKETYKRYKEIQKAYKKRKRVYLI